MSEGGRGRGRRGDRELLLVLYYLSSFWKSSPLWLLLFELWKVAGWIKGLLPGFSKLSMQRS